VKTYKTDTPRITLAMLRGACKEQRDIFRKEWPDGADVTIKNVRRAREAARALVVRDLISREHFDTLYGPWASVMENTTSNPS